MNTKFNSENEIKVPVTRKRKKDSWAYTPAQVSTIYARTVPRDKLFHTNGRIHWELVISGFFERIKVGFLPTDCYDWLGAGHRQGYGMYVTKVVTDGVLKRTQMNSQRLALAIHLGRALDASERVYATCNNPSCTNPAHLKIGDRSICRQNGIDSKRYPKEWVEAHSALLLYGSREELRARLGLTNLQIGNARPLAKKYAKQAGNQQERGEMLTEIIALLVAGIGISAQAKAKLMKKPLIKVFPNQSNTSANECANDD
jgi:hypothetical protein